MKSNNQLSITKQETKICRSFLIRNIFNKKKKVVNINHFQFKFIWLGDHFD
jgi:hypothetical protein